MEFFDYSLAIFYKDFRIFRQKWAQNDLIWRMEHSEKPKFWGKLDFEGYDGSRMSKMHSGGV